MNDQELILDLKFVVFDQFTVKPIDFLEYYVPFRFMLQHFI